MLQNKIIVQYQEQVGDYPVTQSIVLPYKLDPLTNMVTITMTMEALRDTLGKLNGVPNVEAVLRSA